MSGAIQAVMQLVSKSAIPHPHLHPPLTCILFEFIPFFFSRSGSDATWKDMTHTLTLPSVILPSFSGLLHTPDGGHPAPSLNRHSSPVLSAPQAGHWGGSAHAAGAHSHCAGKATTITHPLAPIFLPPPSGEKACNPQWLTASSLSSSSSSSTFPRHLFATFTALFFCNTKSQVFISGTVSRILTRRGSSCGFFKTYIHRRSLHFLLSFHHHMDVFYWL